MLVQLLYMLSGNDLRKLAVIVSAIAALYLLAIFRSKVRIGTPSNLLSCSAGLVSPLMAVLPRVSGIFGMIFPLRYIVETVLLIAAALALLKSKKPNPASVLIILGNALFMSIAGAMIPLGLQESSYFLKTALAVGAFGFFIWINDRDLGPGPIKGGSGVIIPGSGDYVIGNIGENDGYTAYDRGTGRSFHYENGEWYQDGNLVPSASAHAWGLDAFYNNYIAGHDLFGRNPYDSN